MIYNLQLMRALAALAVVYLHVVSDAGLGLPIGVGGFGVDIFFVVSGFTMAYVGRTSAAEFAVRRLIRIVPLYWLATLGTFAVAWWSPRLIQSASASVPHLVHSLLFVPYPNRLGLLQPTLALGWTLNYEMYFYALFAAALLCTRRFAPLLTCAMLAAVASLLRAAGLRDGVETFYADPIVFEFALGIAVYYLTAGLTARPTGDPRAGLIRAALFAAAILAACVLPWQERSSPGSRFLSAGVPAAVLVCSAVSLERTFGLAARNRIVVLLGDSSYVLYLIHPYIVYGIVRLFLHPDRMGAGALAVSVGALMLAAAVAAVAIHVTVELPLTRYLRTRMGPARAPVRPINAVLLKE